LTIESFAQVLISIGMIIAFLVLLIIFKWKTLMDRF